MAQADTVRFICSSCGYRARIPAGFSGKVILCPGCQKMQIASPDDGAATGGTVSVSKVTTASEGSTGQVSVVDAQGKIRFTCAKCGFQAKLASSYAGKAISCPKCQAPQLIPPVGEAHLAAGDAALPAEAPAAAPSRPSAVVKAPSELAEEPGITVEETTPFEARDQEAGAAAPAPAAPPAASTDAPAAGAPSSPSVPAVKPKRSSAPKAPAGPPKGVVRRGGRAGAALAAEEEASAIAEEEAALDAEEEAQAKSKELPAFLKPYESQIERLRQPKVLVIAGVCLLALVLEISLVVAWRSAAGALAELRPKFDKAVKDLETSTDKLTHAQFDLSVQSSKVKESADKVQLIQGSLAESQKETEDEKAKAKQAESDHQKEYDLRKAVENKLDATLDKLSKAVQARDEDYKKRVEAEKARDEESRLRKELKDNLDELAKAPK